MPEGNPAGYLPDDIKNDAIARLLVEKYGVLPDQVPAMRAAILDGTAAGSDSLKQEAAEQVAGREQARLKEMEYLGHLASNPELRSDPKFKKDYDKFIEQGRVAVREEAARRKAELDDDITRMSIGPEIERTSNASEYLQDLRQEPGGGFSSGFRQPEDFSGLVPLPERRRIAAPPNRTSIVIPAPGVPPVKVESSSPQPEAPAPQNPQTPENILIQGGKIAPEDVYRARLQRALAMRRAALGK